LTDNGYAYWIYYYVVCFRRPQKQISYHTNLLQVYKVGYYEYKIIFVACLIE